MRTATPTIREVLTPEGMPLRFRIASPWDRIGAFVMDEFRVFGLMLLLVLLAGFALGALGFHDTAVIMIVIHLGIFALRQGYFIWGEQRGRGRTYGKRQSRIRVVDRCGGPLRTEAIIARNLVREVEVYLPLMVIVAPGRLFPGAPVLAGVLGGAWLLVFALLPLFNRERLRMGDLIAGTMVVEDPEAVLLDDLTAQTVSAGWKSYVFTPEQLSHYGIHELQVLEEILRTGRSDTRGLQIIARKIAERISWNSGGVEVKAEPFLRSFYDAQRKHLESRLLMGGARERKS